MEARLIWDQEAASSSLAYSTITYTGGNMQINDKGFLLCPQCGKKTKTKVIPGITRIIRFPLFCPWCREEIMIDYK